MGRKALPIHQTAIRDCQLIATIDKRMREVDSKYVTDEQREAASKAAKTLAEVLTAVHKAYWGV